MMKRWIKGISLALAIALMSPQAALAARGPGVGGETAGSGDTSVRLFPGWNGAGTISPMISTSPDEFDGPDDDDSYPQGWRYSPSGWWYQYADGGWPVNGWKYIDSLVLLQRRRPRRDRLDSGGRQLFLYEPGG
ncbi:MAG: hypothetical protein ACLTC4_11685 [Hungatella hathewayi]